VVTVKNTLYKALKCIAKLHCLCWGKGETGGVYIRVQQEGIIQDDAGSTFTLSTTPAGDSFDYNKADTALKGRTH
jgi:hypothetical protein